ncbi:MAG: serine/threonine-protein kinase [Acidobacteria bacterium]|nr:serine/threonine-protein kinase [Acidobacteriota bacterium]
MTGQESWARLDELLDGALHQPPELRHGWVVEACGGDEGLRARVESLLALAEGNDADLTPAGALRGPLWDEFVKELEPEEDPGLPPGSRLGPYEIRGLLGAGGMGRVYRAYDPGLDRDVAIKALSGHFAAEPTSLRRFQREARLLAHLDHPNIASIHEVHVFDGRPHLVLELVEGETLDEILTRGALPPGEAITIARQVAEALEEAHGKGIIHRDLKPSNVKVSPDTRVKVLDFGLARRVARGAGPGASSSGTLTREGAVLGTIPYMSPEQAQGERVDERTDIWALGCLLYEMLTGRRAVPSQTVPDLIASLLRDEVDLSALPAETPPALHRLIRRCLRRDPRQRFQDVGDARLDLEELEGGPETQGARPSSVAAGGRWPATVPWALAALAMLGALAIALLGPGRSRPPGGDTVRQFVLDLPPDVSLPRNDHASPVALSPDGSTVVLVGEGTDAVRLYRRRLEHLDWTPLPETEGAEQPFFSADGREVGFFARGRLMRVSPDGQRPFSVTEIEGRPCGAAWAPDGAIVFAPSRSSGLVRVEARGGAPRPITALDDGERSHRWPQVLPDGRTVLFTVERQHSTFDDATIETVSLETGKRRRLMRGGSHARSVPGGHLVYARGGQLFAVPFDPARSRVTGAPVRVLESLAYDPGDGGTKMAVADDGSLAYVPTNVSTQAPRLVLAQGWARSLLTRRGPGRS